MGELFDIRHTKCKLINYYCRNQDTWPLRASQLLVLFRYCFTVTPCRKGACWLQELPSKTAQHWQKHYHGARSDLKCSTSMSQTCVKNLKADHHEWIHEFCRSNLNALLLSLQVHLAFVWDFCDVKYLLKDACWPEDWDISSDRGKHVWKTPHKGTSSRCEEESIFRNIIIIRWHEKKEWRYRNNPHQRKTKKIVWCEFLSGFSSCLHFFMVIYVFYLICQKEHPRRKEGQLSIKRPQNWTVLPRNLVFNCVNPIRQMNYP